MQAKATSLAVWLGVIGAAAAQVVAIPSRPLVLVMRHGGPQNGRASALGWGRRLVARIGRQAAQATMSVAIGLVACLYLTACGASRPPEVVRPSGQALVAVIAAGEVDRIRWQIEVVRIGGRNCSQSVAQYKIMATDCDDAPTSDEYPVNIAVEGNEKIVFVRGVAGAQVSRLTSITSVRTGGYDLAIELIDGVRYFGYAVRPSEVVDLIGYNSNGERIYSGGEKILSTFSKEPDPGSSQLSS